MQGLGRAVSVLGGQLGLRRQEGILETNGIRTGGRKEPRAHVLHLSRSGREGYQKVAPARVSHRIRIHCILLFRDGRDCQNGGSATPRSRKGRAKRRTRRGTSWLRRQRGQRPRCLHLRECVFCKVGTSRIRAHTLRLCSPPRLCAGFLRAIWIILIDKRSRLRP
ncbi:hypothetical protein BC832DRAFT_308686 [Gaertneriomyces semiglobifer]|nr:hypothetical protein BC832DRAFT_308686 [Gaertneriomyces semiglobifer]